MTCERWINMDLKELTFYPLSDNLFKVKEIRCNASGEEVPSVQLLAIKPVITKSHTNKCIYKNTEQDDHHCSLKSPEQWAHFHVTAEEGKDGLLDKKHYIILFIERKDLGNAAKLFDKFKDTVEWLNIKGKHIGFRIFFFGVDGFNPALTVVDNNTATEKFKEQINKYILKENNVEYLVTAATESLGKGEIDKERQAVSSDSRRKPTMLTIRRETDKIGHYKFNVA